MSKSILRCLGGFVERHLNIKVTIDYTMENHYDPELLTIIQLNLEENNYGKKERKSTKENLGQL